MNKNINGIELEEINNEIYKVQNIAKTLRLAVISTDYTNLTMSVNEIGTALEIIEQITDSQTLKISEYL